MVGNAKVGNTQSLALPANYNTAEGGQGYTIRVNNGEVFFAGMAFDGLTVDVRPGASYGFDYDDTANDLTVYLPTATKIRYVTGETEALTGMADSEIIPGSVVVIEKASNSRNNGTYVVKSFTAASALLKLQRIQFDGILGDIKDGVDDRTNDTKGKITLLPFSNAYKIVALSTTSSTIGTLRANNLAGSSFDGTELPQGVDLRADIWQFAAGSGDAFILYCQCPPSKEFYGKKL